MRHIATDEDFWSSPTVDRPQEPAPRSKDDRRAEARAFLEHLTRGVAGWVMVGSVSTPTAYDLSDPSWLDRAAEAAASMQGNCYATVSAMSESPRPGSRGKAENAGAVMTVSADLDVLGPTHKGTDLPPTIADAESLIAQLDIEPTYVIHTGGGLQAHWIIDGGATETDRARRTIERLQGALRALARGHGWSVDSTADLARQMRVPGTMNAKPELPTPIPVTVHRNGGPAWQLDALEAMLADKPVASASGAATGGNPEVAYDGEIMTDGRATWLYHRVWDLRHLPADVIVDAVEGMAAPRMGGLDVELSCRRTVREEIARLVGNVFRKQSNGDVETHDAPQGLAGEPLREYRRTRAEAAGAGRPAPDAFNRVAPELDEAALHGIAGRIVEALRPHTEACDAAMLAQILAAAGNAMCRDRDMAPRTGPHLMIGNERQGPREFFAIVGATSGGRKGTSYSAIEPILYQALGNDAWWSRIEGGIASGEALVAQLAPRKLTSREKEKGEVSSPRDPRMLIFENELARLLVAGNREGSTLSPLLRKAFDGGDLTHRTVDGSVAGAARDVQVSMVGHITAAELAAAMTDLDKRNGLGNRIIYVHSKRARVLTLPEPLGAGAVTSLGMRLKRHIYEARQIGRVAMGAEAREAWDALYQTRSPEMDADPPANVHLVARWEAHILRLSLIYALLDGSSVILPEHYEAALAVWNYAERTVEYVYGGRPATGVNLAAKLEAFVVRRGSSATVRECISGVRGLNDTAGVLATVAGSCGRLRVVRAGRGQRVEVVQ